MWHWTLCNLDVNLNALWMMCKCNWTVGKPVLNWAVVKLSFLWMCITLNSLHHNIYVIWLGPVLCNKHDCVHYLCSWPGLTSIYNVCEDVLTFKSTPPQPSLTSILSWQLCWRVSNPRQTWLPTWPSCLTLRSKCSNCAWPSQWMTHMLNISSADHIL